MTQIPWAGDEDAPEGDYSLVWRFIDGSASFVHGIEAGILYQKMISGLSRRIVSTVNSENEEELRNLTNSLGWSATFEELDETWLRGTFTKPPE